MTYRCRRCEYEWEEEDIHACPQCGKLTRLESYVDIVFCIDVSGNMAPVISNVLHMVRKFPTDLLDRLEKKDVKLDQLRVRVVTFGNLTYDSNAIQTTKFFILVPESDSVEFISHIDGLSVPRLRVGGPTSGLEALSLAIASDWTHDGDIRRHLILLFSGSSAHALESQVGNRSEAFSAQVSSSLEELTDRWNGDSTSRLKRGARRLMLFAPDAYPWNVISDCWEQTIWLPSRAGLGQEELEYETMFASVVNSWL